MKTLYLKWQTLVHELAKFGIVGAINTVVDFGIFNVLRAGLGVGPLTSSTIALVVAATSSYLMNRFWTFRHRARSGLGREYALFFILNGIGLGIQLSCIAVSHYGFGFDSIFADNVAKVVGLLIGTVFRFLTYKRWVFMEPEEAAGRSVAEGSVAEIDIEPGAVGSRVSYAHGRENGAGGVRGDHGQPASDRR
jgi:putative flippase GtrA